MFVEKLWFSIAIFHSENFDFWKVRFYNCFICDLSCTIFSVKFHFTQSFIHSVIQSVSQSVSQS